VGAYEDLLRDYRAGKVGTGTSSGRASMLGDHTKPVNMSGPGKFLHGLGQTLGTPANLISRAAFLPIAEAVSQGDPIALEKLRRLKEQKDNVYLGDILNVGGPLAHQEGDNWATGFAKGTGRFLADVASDPLSYVGFGELTKSGELIGRVSRALEEGVPIKVGSDIARKLGAKVAEKGRMLTDGESITELLKKMPKSLEGKPLAEQIAAGQRSFANFSLPFTDINVPLIGGKVGEALAKPFSSLSRLGLKNRVLRKLEEVYPKAFEEGQQTLKANLEMFVDHISGASELTDVKARTVLRSLAKGLEETGPIVKNEIKRAWREQTKGTPARVIGDVLAPFGTAMKSMFSTATGNKAYDKLMNTFRNLVMYRSSLEIDSGKQLDRMIDDAATEASKLSGRTVTREQMNSLSRKAAQDLKKNGGLPPGAPPPEGTGLPDIPPGMGGIPGQITKAKKFTTIDVKMTNDSMAEMFSKLDKFYNKITHSQGTSQFKELIKAAKSTAKAWVASKEPHRTPRLFLTQLKGLIEGDPKLAGIKDGLIGHIDNMIKKEFTEITPPPSTLAKELPSGFDAKGNIDYSAPLSQKAGVKLLDDLRKSLPESLRDPKFKGHLDNFMEGLIYKVKHIEEGGLDPNKTAESFLDYAALMLEKGSSKLPSKFKTELLAHIDKFAADLKAYRDANMSSPEDVIGKLLSESDKNSGEVNQLLQDFAGEGGYKEPIGPEPPPTGEVPKGILPKPPTTPEELPAGVEDMSEEESQALLQQMTGEIPPTAPPEVPPTAAGGTPPGPPTLPEFGFSPNSETATIWENIKPQARGLSKQLVRQLEPLFPTAFPPGWPQHGLGGELRKALAQLGSHITGGTELSPKALAEKMSTLVQGLKEPPEDIIRKLEDSYADIDKVYINAADRGLMSEPVAKIAKEINERDARQQLIEKTNGTRSLPALADKEVLAAILTQEGRKALVDHLLSIGELPPSYSARDLNNKLAKLIRKDFVEIDKKVVDSWATKDIINLKEVNHLKGERGLEYLDKLLNDGKITDAQFTSAVHAMDEHQANALIAAGKWKGNGHVPVKEFFHTDPVFATTVRGVRGERVRTQAEFFTQLQARKIALPENEAPASWLTVKQPELDGYRLPPEVAQSMDGWYKFIHNPHEQNAFLKLFDQTQDWWKAWTLAIFPAYHVRNFVGNMWNNYLAGVHDPAVYKLALEMQYPAKFGDRSFISGLGQKYTSESLVRAAKELGVVDRGFVAQDIGKTIEQELSKGNLYSAGRDNLLVKKGFEFGAQIENNARLAHFIDKLKKGDTPAEAALSVKRYLFDYSELTDFERTVMKRIFPFYSWTRKNVPLQIQHLVMEPARFHAAYKAQNEMENSTPTSERYLPSWMSENFPLRIRKTKNGKYEYFLLNNWLPAADLAKVSQIHQLAINMMSPIPKEIIQQIYNHDFFMNREIEKIPGQKEKFLGMELPSRIVHGAKIVRALNELDKLSAEDTDFLNKISGVMSGKTYLYDPLKGFSVNKVRVDEEIKSLKQGLRKEASKPHPNTTEMARIRALIQKAAEEY
jgi:hypothetical protein